jgi:hypothetical protein
MRTTVSYFSFIILLLTLVSCNDDNQRSYVQYYQPGTPHMANQVTGAILPLVIHCQFQLLYL